MLYGSIWHCFITDENPLIPDTHNDSLHVDWCKGCKSGKTKFTKVMLGFMKYNGRMLIKINEYIKYVRKRVHIEITLIN